MQNFITDLRSALKEIYRTVRYDMIDELYQYNGYGAGGDLSSNVDLLAEKIYIKYLSHYGQIISEESGIIGKGEWKLIIDPIDGSDNLLSSFPYYGTSIAVQKDGEMLLSCVANFANGDLFIKYDGGFFKGKILESDMKPVKYHPFSKIGLFEKAYANPKIVARLNANGLKFRSPGAVALSLAYAYSVKYVLFVGKIREYDIAAGLHLCSDCYIYQDTTTIIVSKDKAIFDKIKEIVLKDE